jgi:chlorite dismutase
MSNQPASPSQRPRAREINAALRYTCWAVFRPAPSPGSGPRSTLADCVTELAGHDVVVRGFYDVSGMRADANVMVWLHGPDAASLQAGVRRIRRDGFQGGVELAWSGVGLHRPAEFNKGHVPAFLAGAPAQPWLVVYPFVRSYDWYLLPEQERRALLVEHGMMGREYPSVLSNTVAAFALGDYEWILALEGPELHDIVDLMRHLRGSGARRHVRVETPFFTGHLVDIEGAWEALG